MPITSYQHSICSDFIKLCDATEIIDESLAMKFTTLFKELDATSGNGVLDSCERVADVGSRFMEN